MKNAIKKAISLLLVAVMVFGAAPLAGFVGLELPEFNLFGTKAKAEETETTISGTLNPDDWLEFGDQGFYGTLKWSIDKVEKILTIDCDGLMYNFGDPYIYYAPWSYHKSHFDSVVISENCTSIGVDAFVGCDNIKSIDIHDGITSIGGAAFFGCTGLETVVIGNGVKNIGYSAFENCTSLAIITIPNRVTSIGSSVFKGCTSLSDITIPDSVTSISESAFYGCTGLESITIPETVTNIARLAFYNCKKLKDVYYNGDVTGWIGIKFDYDAKEYYYDYKDYSSNPMCYATNLYFDGELVKEIAIPDGVTSIRERAFYNCTSLESITIPESVTSIGDSAFYGCLDLENIVIPDSVTSLGSSVFSGCTNLETVTVLGNETVLEGTGLSTKVMICCYKDSAAYNFAVENSYAYYLLDVSEEENTISGKVGTKLTWSIDKKARTLAIDNEGAMVSFVSENAPWRQHKNYIFNVVINHGCTSIGKNAFLDCKYLRNIDIPYSVTTIGANAFEACTSLINIEIPESVSKIEDRAFYGCSNLASITIPDSVTSLGSSVFYGCTNLVTAVIGNGVKSISSSAFEKCTSLASVKIGDGVTSIAQYAFRYCSDLETVTVPDGVISIGASAFYGCTALETAIIGNGVTSIGASAFYGCTALETAIIGNGVISMGSSAFNGCTSLASITIPDSVTAISENAFYGCKSLETAVIGNGVKSISSSAFEKCTSLASVEIGDGVTSIAQYAFRYCSGLETVTVPDGVISIGASAFYGCTGLETAIIGNGVTSIGDSAFYGCSSLKSVKVGNGVKTVSGYAFAYCPSLSDVYFYSKTCSIAETSISIYPTIHGYAGSTAEIFADKYGYEFIPIVDNPCEEHTYTDSCDTLCDVCGYKREITHSFGEWVITKEPTCVARGVKERTCSVCGRIEKYAIEISEDHSYTDSCDASCDLCGKTREVSHNFGDWTLTKEPTCDMFGVMERSCSECGAKETDYTAKLTEHTYTDTCDTDCDVCGKTREINHSYGEWIVTKEPTCGASGTKERTCSVCSHVEEDSVAKLEKHTYKNSCDTDCDVCGETREINHSYGEWIVTKEPTCAETGTKERVCSVSGCVESDVIETLPHTDENNDGICEVCDTQFEIKPIRNGTCGENLTWTLDEFTGELVISGTGEMTNWSDSTAVPWYKYAKSIKTVTVSDGVISIGDYAFLGCFELTSVTIGNDVTSIGYYSFGTCSKLGSVNIPDGVTKIGNRAFAYCHNLRNITIPDNVISIEPLAFLDSGYATIICKSGSYAHVYAVQNGIKYILEDNNGTAFEIKNTVLISYGGVAENVVLPSDVAAVGIDAFKGNSTVNFIEIPYSVTKIHTGAFADCPNLDSVAIPFTVTEISDAAFTGTNAKIYCYNNSYAHNYAVANGIAYEFITVTLSTNSVRMAMGETVAMQAVPSITLASGVPFVWESSDTSVATIDENGKVTANNDGEATISAVAPNGSTLATCSVSVAPAEAVVADIVKRPTQTTISYGDAIILHVDETKIPAGGRVEWTASNGNFSKSVSSDGTTCEIRPEKSGDTTFTATIYDAKGNAVSTDEQTMTSKAGFFDKIIAFFKKLFGLTKVIPQAFKGIY